MNAALVNCEPWSLLKIAGLPQRVSASSSASMRNPALSGIETRTRIASLGASIESLEKQIGKRGKRITPEMVDTFGALVRERLHGDDPALRKAYVALFVSQVAIDQRRIRIAGSTAMLKKAVGKTEPGLLGMLPALDRKWCGREASNSMFAVVRHRSLSCMCSLLIHVRRFAFVR